MQEAKSRGGALAAIIELTKVKITVAVTLSTLTGYVLYAGAIDGTAIWASLGVFLLASSSAALNQVQERRTDTLMSRTRKRPLPSKRISVKSALIVVLCLLLAGSLILYFMTSKISFGIGLVTLLWYNLLYTPLKYRSVFALIIGSVIGALPPVIGFTAAGGDVFDPTIIFLAFFIYVWQVPHFIMLLLLYGNDYRDAGLPVLTTYYPDEVIKRIIFVWILGTMILGFMLPFMCRLQHLTIIVFIMLLSAGLMISMIGLLSKKRLFRVKLSFIFMNIYLVIVLVLILIDSLI
ncbi:MAG: protoheme IX farnesyltransferase [Bacteroidales bacterium]|jgi:protoheme IX farnesyltransferase|nr:protoheme IX farnesyltransferase [Bacteroidales bacterium]